MFILRFEHVFVYVYAYMQGARDPDGAQLLLFTASKHDSKSCDHKTSMQLLFLILDQVSERLSNYVCTIFLHAHV